MSAAKFIKIFKTGTFKDSTGKEHTITTEELDRRVTLYNEQQEDAKRKAPHVIGHPTHNAPAYGWVGKLKREGQYLLASCEEMADSFVEAVNSKAYKFRSASFYGDGLLRHVGWLGAAQPAVPGLDEVSFADDADMVLFEDFMDWETAWGLNRAGELFQRFRDWIIEQSGLEVADSVMPQWNIDGLKNAKADQEEFNDPTPIKDINMTELEKKLETLQSNFTQLQTELTTVKAERDALKTASDAQAASFASLTTQVAQLSELNVRRDIENYCDKMIADKKMLPAERQYFVDDLTAKAKISTSDFAEGESPLAKARAMLEARSAHSLFTEFATGERASNPADAGSQRMPSNVSFSEEGADLDAAIRKVMLEKSINYNDAFELVAQEL